jgi:hypothetical protein
VNLGIVVEAESVDFFPKIPPKMQKTSANWSRWTEIALSMPGTPLPSKKFPEIV